MDLVAGRVRQADGAAALNDALARVVAGIWTSIDRDRLRAEFELRPDAPPSREAGLHLFQNARGVGPGAHRSTLPETETHTFVYRCLTATSSRAPHHPENTFAFACLRASGSPSPGHSLGTTGRRRPDRAPRRRRSCFGHRAKARGPTTGRHGRC
jgi:hypothetical protein